VIPRPTVLYLGLSQLVCWGTAYYLIGGFGGVIAADLGWSRDLVYGGYSVALLVMGFASPLTGRLIDRHGGRAVMATGSVLVALGCAGVALSHGIGLYYASWVCLGLAMRFTLYDAAFATLARMGGPSARRPMSQVTLFGGLASTVFWPFGHMLAEAFGWRNALFVYAGVALLTLPLHLAIPRSRHGEAMPAVGPAAPPAGGTQVERPPLAVAPRDRFAAGVLYAFLTMAVSFLNSGMSAHMINILAGLGLAAGAAVWIATLRGIGQSLARLAEILFGARLDAFGLNMLSTGLLPLAFLAGMASGAFMPAAIAFAFVYGAGNGLTTITRGTLPLALFDRSTYGLVVGRLLIPSFIVSAASPIVYAGVIDRLGNQAALVLSAAVALLAFAAAMMLHLRFRGR
jgi:predicted MFS family arabinose efflux permease